MSKLSKRAILTFIIATFLIGMIPIIPVMADLPEGWTLGQTGDATVGWSTAQSKSEPYSIHLDSGTGEGHEARIVILMPDGFTLGDLDTLSWFIYAVSGYPAHVDIIVEDDIDGVSNIDSLTAELAENVVDYTPIPDGYTYNSWLETFEGFTDGPSTIDNSTLLWVTRIGSGVSSAPSGTLAELKDGDVTEPSGYVGPTITIDADVVILQLEIEVDHWSSRDGSTASEVYIDDIEINGVTYPLEKDVPGSEDFTIDYVTPGDVDYGDVLTVIGSGITGGSEVIVYWDYPSGTYIHPLNNTEGNKDGSYDLEVTVPSDVVGDHYLWIRDVSTGATVKSGAIPMIPKIKLSPSSGLKNDDITIKGYGFAEDSEIDIELGALSDDGGDDVEETDDLGYFEYTFEVNTDDPKKYPVTAEDEKGNDASANFKLGAAISLDIDEGPTGTVVTVDGRGWSDGDIMTFRDKANPSTVIEVVDGDTITVGSTGRFSAEVVIPELGNEGVYDIEAYGSDSKATSSDGFELTGLPEIVVTPTYGTPGSIITVTGTNFTQIAGTEVTIILDSTDLVIAETDSDGTFEDTFMSPAVVFQTYDVQATDEYSLFATDPFKVGLIALIINPVYGEAGTSLFITGIGFADGDYNLTFGIKLYEEFGTVDEEALSDYFYVPNVPTGPYDIIISDEDGNEMTVEFRVTAVTEVTLDPASAPNKYNVTIEGCNFADYVDTVDFVLYNATDEWDMKVQQGKDPGKAVKTGKDGNFTAWWKVLDEDTLSLGDYTINVTGYDDFFLQIPFSVVEAKVDVAPRKALFDRGDTIQFKVKNDFTFTDAYMKIWDPDDNLYWQTDTFEEWLKVGDLYTVPYYTQTSGMNLMELSQDAPLGIWTYVFYETGTTQLTNGTFAVGPSAESLLTEKIEALSEELGIDIDTLRTVIDDLGIDMDEAVSSMAAEIATAVSSMEDDFDDAVTGMQDDISDLSDDIDDMGTKMDSIETMVDDISETSGDAQQAANDAKTAAEQATEAAEANQQATSGLTGLVYGAIGASLIAALAAIVSLMQISRRIAG